MASTAELISILKFLVDLLQYTRKDSSASNAQMDAMGSSSSSAHKLLEQGDRMSLTALETALRGFSSVVKDNMRDIKDFVSEKASRIEQRMSELEDVIGGKLICPESDICTSQEVKIIADRLTSLEENMCTYQAMREELSRFEKNACTSKEVKVIADGLTFLEKNMSTSEEVKLMGNKLEEKLASLEELEGFKERLTGLEKTSISKKTKMEPLLFHSELNGKRVKLTSDFRTAERIDPRNNCLSAGVISQRTLRDDEVFNIRIEETIDKGTVCGIGFGVIRDPGMEIKTSYSITRNPSIKGTWAIYSGPYTSSPGTSNAYKDGSLMTTSCYPLDTLNLSVGTVLGVSCRKNGDLHFYIDGVDKGVAFTGVSKDVHAFVDICYSVTKINIVD